MKKVTTIAIIAGAAATIPAYLLVRKLIQKKQLAKTAAMPASPPVEIHTTDSPSKAIQPESSPL